MPSKATISVGEKFLYDFKATISFGEKFLYDFKAGQRAASGRPRPASTRCLALADDAPAAESVRCHPCLRTSKLHPIYLSKSADTPISNFLDAQCEVESVGSGTGPAHLDREARCEQSRRSRLAHKQLY
jgi:hypothetical protein